MPTLKLKTVLVHMDPIKAAHWDPMGEHGLAICTGGAKVFFWSPQSESAACVDVPSDSFQVREMEWSRGWDRQAGASLLLKDAAQFCVVYMAPELAPEPAADDA